MFNADQSRELQSILGSRFTAEQAAAIKKALYYVLTISQESDVTGLAFNSPNVELTLANGAIYQADIVSGG